jgi:hypothetical protein
LGEVSYCTGDQAGADECFDAALTLATNLGMRPLVAQCYLELGKLYCRTGDRVKSQEHLTTAVTMYREGISFWLEEAEAEAELQPPQGNSN